jgi:hypothetical protein
VQKKFEYIAEKRVMLVYSLPLNEIVLDFYDRLKSVSRGYASLDYHLAGYIDSDLVKLDLMVAGEPVDALSIIVHRLNSQARGRLLGLYLFAFAGVAPIGGLFAGWLADVGGTPLAFSVAGATSLVTVAVASARRSSTPVPAPTRQVLAPFHPQPVHHPRVRTHPPIRHARQRLLTRIVEVQPVRRPPHHRQGNQRRSGPPREQDGEQVVPHGAVC